MFFPIAISIFLAVFCLVIALYLGATGIKASPKSELRRRLRHMANQAGPELPEGLRSEITKETAPLDRLLLRFSLARALDKKLDFAGLRVTVSVFVMIAGALAIAGAAVAAFLTRWALAALPGAAASVLLTLGYLTVKIKQRGEKFTELFPEALTMIARSLRAGHSFNTAIQLVGLEIPNPVGELFKMAYDQQLLGLRITDGLSNLNTRIDSLDLRFFTTVININSEIGGNLAEILDKLSMTIRERLRIRRQVRVYTAQGRMSGYILGALPIITFFLFNMLSPGYESTLIKEPIGIAALVLAAVMQIAGFLAMRNIIKIKI